MMDRSCGLRVTGRQAELAGQEFTGGEGVGTLQCRPKARRRARKPHAEALV